MSRYYYTDEQIQFLKENVKDRSYLELTEMFNKRFNANKSLSAIHGQCKKRKIQNGRTGRFYKGMTSHNKGKRGIVYGGEATQFKKGNKPKNTRPVGSVLVGTDGYVLIKIKEKGTRSETWRPKHELIWEEVNGSKPDKHVIIFADGNKRNFDIDNLILVKKSELLKMNRQKLIYSDTELTKVGLNIVKLQEKLSEMEG